MVWRAICYYDAFEMKIVDYKMTGSSYKAVLESSLPETREKFGFIYWFSQQDNLPVHTSRVVKTLIALLNFETLARLPYSTDLNIIENLWRGFTHRVYGNVQ